MCPTAPQSDAVPCTQLGDTGNCLELPVKYRDFKNESVSGGHPDFFFLGSTWTSTDPRYQAIAGVQGQTGSISFNKRYCVPNSSGPARQNDSTARSWDIAQATLNGNGGHVANYSTTAAYAPTEGITYVSGASGNPMYHGCAPVVTSATTFGQWWQDGTYATDGTTATKHALGTIA